MTETTTEVAVKPAPKSDRELVYVPLGENKEVKLSINQVRKFLTTPTRNGAQPTDEQVVQFMMLCEARQLNPWVGDAYLVGFDTRDGAQFSLITAVQALLKRAETHPHYDGMEHGVIVRSNGDVSFREGSFVCEGEILLGGWATAYRKDRSRPEKAMINIETYHTHRSRWEADPAGMIEKVAIAAALRRAFPTQTGGLYLHEEYQDNGGVDTSVAAQARGLGAITQRLQSQHSLPAPNVMDVPTQTIETRKAEPAKKQADKPVAAQKAAAAEPEVPKAAPNQYSAQAKAESPKAKAKAKSKATGSQMEFPGPPAKPVQAAPPQTVEVPTPQPDPEPETDETSYAPVGDDEQPLLEGEEPVEQEQVEPANHDPLDVNWNTLLSYPPQDGDQEDVILAKEYREYIRKVVADKKQSKSDRIGLLSGGFANVMAEVEGSWGIGAMKKLKQIGTEIINAQ
jgi:phage recombination protein Bet